MNSRIEALTSYPFERLRALLRGLAPGKDPINLGIGEPQHPTPAIITDAIVANLHLLGKYPPTGGTSELRMAIADWHVRRYSVELDAETQIIPVAGTREALFAVAQALIEPSDPGCVLLPNPYYQIYEGAAILAGAEPVYVPTPSDKGYLPDWEAVPVEKLRRAKLAYLCSPGNPAGAVMKLKDWRMAFELADQFGFSVIADECYSEIYFGTPPVGALQAAQELGRGCKGILAFNSISKRSNAPGLRSGFVAGDPDLIAPFLLYRTYHGAAPSSLTQAASVRAWEDEEHVEANRAKYRAKMEMVQRELPGVRTPEGGFFLWLPVQDDEDFARRAFVEQGMTVLPGRYLGKASDGLNPGQGHVRVALVSDLGVCERAIERLKMLI